MIFDRTSYRLLFDWNLYRMSGRCWCSSGILLNDFFVWILRTMQLDAFLKLTNNFQWDPPRGPEVFL